jgi:hypothetical protein
MDLFQVNDEKLNQIFKDLEERDWYIDEETENEINERLTEEDALCDIAGKVKQLEEGAKSLREWKRDADARIRKMEEGAGRMRAAMTLRLTIMEATGQKPRVKAPHRGLTFWKSEGQEKIHRQDDVLDKKHHKTGFTEEQVNTCSIPRTFFKPTTLYNLDEDLIKEYLASGQKIKGVELVSEPFVVIRAGG